MREIHKSQPHSSRRPVLAAAICALLLPFSAHATLIGDTVNCTQTGPSSSFTCQPTSATVIDPGSEFFVGNTSPTGFSVDIDASSITFAALSNISLGSTIVELSSLDWVGAPGFISNAILSSVTGITGLAQGDVSFGPHSVTVDFRSTTWVQGGRATVDLVTNHVPEPATLALLGLGLAGFGAARARRHN